MTVVLEFKKGKNEGKINTTSSKQYIDTYTLTKFVKRLICSLIYPFSP